MKMKDKLIALVLILVIGTKAWGQDSPQHHVQFEKAKYVMETKGDLRGAIELFEEILEKHPDDGEVAAKAQLRIGICYERLGNMEAQRAYQSVIDNYPNQTTQVAEARARMAKLIGENQSNPTLTHIYSRDDDGFYLERHSLSPDGTKLLGITMTPIITHGQNVAYKDLVTGEFKRITTFDWQSEGHGFTYNPIWSPDGKEVAFNYHGWHTHVWELRVTDLYGKSRIIFTGEPDGKDKIYPCDWFPNGESILACYITREKRTQLGIVPAGGGALKVLYEPDVPKDVNFIPDARKYFLPDLSPDGKHVVFHLATGDDRNLYLLDIASKEVKILIESPADESQPLWSPDGRTIAFLSNRMGNQALWAVHVDEQGYPRGLPFIMNHSMEHATLSNWTAHGISYSDWISMRDIYTMPVDSQTGAPTGKPKQLDFRPTGNNAIPVYSPDDKYLAFTMYPRKDSPGRKIVIYPVSGGEAQVYTIPSKNTWVSIANLRWLPDGSGISFCAETSEETPGWEEGMRPYRLYILDLDSDQWRTHALEGGGYYHVEWRGDGRGYYYNMISESGQQHLVEGDLQTGEEKILFDIPSGIVDRIRSHADSKLAVSSRGNRCTIFDIKTGEKLKEFEDSGLWAWSPDGQTFMGRINDRLAYGVISFLDGTKNEYDLSENLPNGDRLILDWSSNGDQIAFSFRFSQFDAYIMSDVIAAERR